MPHGSGPRTISATSLCFYLTLVKSFSTIKLAHLSTPLLPADTLISPATESRITSCSSAFFALRGLRRRYAILPSHLRGGATECSTVVIADVSNGAREGDSGACMGDGYVITRYAIACDHIPPTGPRKPYCKRGCHTWSGRSIRSSGFRLAWSPLLPPCPGWCLTRLSRCCSRQAMDAHTLRPAARGPAG